MTKETNGMGEEVNKKKMTRDELAQYFFELMNRNPKVKQVTLEECYKFVDKWPERLKKHKDDMKDIDLPDNFEINP